MVSMSRSVRYALAASLIALHTAVSIGGAGLHALPGFGHNSGLTALAKNDHSHGPGKSSHETADECAVCQFFAQGQIGCELSAGVTAPIAIDRTSPERPVPDLTPSYRRSEPRGPPAV
jgi:hypothetical protein